MRSATDGRRHAAGVVEVLASAAVLLLWTALALDLDRETSPNAAVRVADAASGPVLPTPSGSGVPQAR